MVSEQPSYCLGDCNAENGQLSNSPNVYIRKIGQLYNCPVVCSNETGNY